MYSQTFIWDGGHIRGGNVAALKKKKKKKKKEQTDFNEQSFYCKKTNNAKLKHIITIAISIIMK